MNDLANLNLTTLPSNIGGISIPDAIRGPLSALYGPGKYEKAIYRYPRDLGSNPARKHSIVFTVLKHKPQQLAQVGSDINALFSDVMSSGGDISSKAKELLNDNTKTIQEKLSDLTNVPGFSEKLGQSSRTLFNSVSQFFIKGNREVGDTIGLYIPDTVNVHYGSDYDTADLSTALGRLYFLAQGATSLTKAFTDQKDRTITNMVNAAGNDPFLREMVFGKMIGGALGMDISRQVLSAGGYAMNPQTQVLFRGVDFRTFQFDFVFTPYSREESVQVKNIIDRFKYYAAPQIDSNGIFNQGMYMKIPDSFDIKFYYGNEENRNVHRIGECVLTDINVDYAGSGQWSTFNDGSPNQIRLTLQFKETFIVDKNRIKEGY